MCADGNKNNINVQHPQKERDLCSHSIIFSL
jgi:hypothetical protein